MKLFSLFSSTWGPGSSLRRRFTPGLALNLGVALALAATPLAACDDPFPEEPVREFGDFGTEVYELIHDEFLWSGTPAEGAARAAAWSAHRQPVIDALNAMTAGKVEDGMLPLLEEFLPFYDDRQTAAGTAPGIMPVMTRDLASIFADLAASPATLEAVAALGLAPEANPYAITRFFGAVIRHRVELIDPMVDMTLELEPELTEFFRWLSHELPTLEESAPEPATSQSFIQRLLSVTIDFADEPIGPVTWSARFDTRGAPVVLKNPDGSLPAPFFDGDNDGLPDIDTYARFVDSNGAVIELPTFSSDPTRDEVRDNAGRASRDTRYLFDYFDLRRTAIAFILRDMRELAADGVHHDLFTILDATLGGRVQKTDVDGTYNGFDVANSPLLDLVHLLNEIRGYPRLVPLLRSVERFSEDKNALFRQLFVDIAKIRRIVDGAPGLTDGNAMFEDIHPVLSRLSKGGGIRALMAASRKAGTDKMFDAMVTMMANTGLSLPNDMSLLQLPEDVDNLTFTNPTPFTTPDTLDTHRSWLQKAAYLLADTRGAPVYMKLFDRVEVKDIVITEDMADFYVRSLADQAFLVLSPEFLIATAIQLVDEFNDAILQSEELNLFMNHDQPVVGNPVGNRGVQVRQSYGPALLALQTSGNLDAMRPWVKDLVAKNLVGEFVGLFDVLARHYSETAFVDGPFVSDGTGFRRLEPTLIRILTETDLAEHFLQLSAWADETTLTVDGQTLNVADELDRFTTWLLDPDADVRTRSGATSIQGIRGVIQNPSRMQLLVDSLDRLDLALDGYPGAREAWDRLDLLSLYLDLEDDGQTLKNRHALELLTALTPILADEAAQFVAEPDWRESLDTLVPDLEEALAGRGFTALTDAMRRVKDTPRHREFFDTMTTALLQEIPDSPETDLFGRALEVLSTAGQVRFPVDVGTRLAKFAGPLLTPSRRLMFNPLESMRDMRKIDEDLVTTDLMRNLLAEPTYAKMPFTALLEAFKSAMRPIPGSASPYTADDLRLVIARFSDWLRDDKKGMEHMYQVIRSR